MKRVEEFAREIRRAFTRTRYRVSGGRVLVPAAPVDPYALLTRGVNLADEEEHEALCREFHVDDMYDTAAVLKALEARWSGDTLAYFYWDGFGMMSSDASLTFFRLGDGRAYVCVKPPLEDEPLTVVAAIEPQDSAKAFSAFFQSFISRNGTTYGVEIFGGLPSRTSNGRPDLVPVEVVFNAYRKWMAWATRAEGPEVWTSLRDSVISEMAEPDQLKRSMRALKLGLQGGIAGMAKRLEETASEGAALSRANRALILQNYFERSYSE